MYIGNKIIYIKCVTPIYKHTLGVVYKVDNGYLFDDDGCCSWCQYMYLEDLFKQLHNSYELYTGDYKEYIKNSHLYINDKEYRYAERKCLDQYKLIKDAKEEISKYENQMYEIKQKYKIVKD